MNEIKRRVFLKNGGLALASVGLVPALGPAFLGRAALAQGQNKKKKTLICLFLRGAMDGLSAVTPHGDPNLYRLRSSIAVPQRQLLDLDGFFGMHPALAPFVPLYKAGNLAVVHACGSTAGTRSHFDAMDYMESGSPGSKSVKDGWLARAALLCPEDRKKANKSPFKAVALGGGMPRILQGDAQALAIPDLKTFGIKGGGSAGPLLADAMAMGSGAADGFETLYDRAVGDVLHGPAEDSFEAMRMLRSIDPTRYVPNREARYPNGRFGTSLMQIAQLIKADVGVEIAFADLGGWDTHAGQIQGVDASKGRLANLLTEMSQGVAALWNDLGDRRNDCVILTMSEFGRTARQNGTGGTDHGTATCFFALGGGIKGGKVYGDWPGLTQEQLHEGRDLKITTDFRAVFGEAAVKHLGVTSLEKLFPGYTGGAQSFRGLL
jgi:uncharacterized protein (DUF1501 family)